MTGPRTTTIAPVGPETWMLEPPKTAATMPAITAVISPLAAPAPELTPKASASGRATMPTVTPAMRSPFQVRGSIRIVPPAGQKRPGRGQGLHRELPGRSQRDARRRRGLGMFELLAGGVQHVVEQQTCHGQQVSDLRVRQGIEHLQGPAFALHQVVTAQHGQMLGQMRGLQARGGEHVSHRHLGRRATAAPAP